jgi:hypothetical protein
LPLSDDIDVDLLISKLAGPLEPAARAAFRRAAEEALARVPCMGPGSAYRAVAVLQRAFFDPPDDHRATWDILHKGHNSKLAQGPPLEHGRDKRFTRHLRLAR